MVHRFLAAPFADPARAAQFAAVLAALEADDSMDALLLGNLVLEPDTAPLDAVLLRPHSISLLVFVPRGGPLSIPALGYGSWLLDGSALPPAAGFDNPFEQFSQQKRQLEAWLQAHLSAEQANLRFISGIVVFGGPLSFGPDVEPQLNSPAAAGFQLLASAADLPRRLRPLATPEIDLSGPDLAQLAAELPEAVPAIRNASPTIVRSTGFDEEPAAEPGEAAPATFFSLTAGRLWRWLGAADIPDDDQPYGADADAAAARNEEKKQLEQLRRQLQADVTQQLQALETRERERERSIAELQSALTQAPAATGEVEALQARLAAETRERAALEAAIQASRDEAATRNQALDAKIEQLNQLITRLQTPAPPLPGAAGPAVAAQPGPGAPVPTPAAAPVANPGPRFRQLRAWRRRLPRLALVAGALAAAGFGIWGLSHLNQPAPVPFEENGRWGYADADGQPVVPARYNSAGAFVAGRAVVGQEGAFGFIDEKGQEVLAPTYDALNPYAGGYARVRVGDAYTFIDEKGQEFDYYYYNALDFTEGYAAVLDHRGWHYISGPEEPAKAPLIFREAYSFVDGLARVRLPGGYTFISPDFLADSTRGTKPFGRYELAADFAGGRARVSQAGRQFFIDQDGDEVK